MKKTVLIILALALLIPFLCSCESSNQKNEEKEPIGYVIIPHHDGDEHVEIYGYSRYNGICTVYCVDGRTITSAAIIIVE